MSSSQQALGFAQGLGASRSWRPPWLVGLRGSDTAWAIAFVIPYVVIFAAFVVYPIIF
jgi:hypothetical protein